jgi:hypothetical protein
MLKAKYPSTPFRFACICYRDPVDSPSDYHDYMDFSSDINSLKSFLGRVNAMGGLICLREIQI